PPSSRSRALPRPAGPDAGRLIDGRAALLARAHVRGTAGDGASHASGPVLLLRTFPMFPSRWKLATYAIVILVGWAIAAPNLFTRQQLAALPGWLPKQQVTLGLDLKGGSHLVLEVAPAVLARRQVGS